MVTAAFKALGDLLSPDFRSVLFKAIGLTIALFIVVFVTVEVLISTLTLLPWPWAETLLAIGTGLALLVAFFFLMAPVTAIFAGFFLDDIAARVERLHYPRDVPGRPLGVAQAVTTALQFALVVLLVNVAVLPTIFTGIQGNELRLTTAPRWGGMNDGGCTKWSGTLICANLCESMSVLAQPYLRNLDRHRLRR